MKVLATDGLELEAVVLLQNAGFEVDVHKSCTAEGLVGIIGRYDAVIIRTATKINARTLENKGELKVICSQTAGFDGIDINAAKERGIVVMNVAGGNANAVAELVLAHILCLARHIIPAYISLGEGSWEKQRFQGTELAGKILGIVGLGHIGSILAKKAQALDMKVCAADPYVSFAAAKSLGVELVLLETLLQTADAISLHTILTPETRHMIGEREFRLMKEGVFFINCARGELVDEKALINALDSGMIKAGIDVFENEPSINWELTGRTQVVTTPHIGGSTREARKFMSIEAAQQIIDGLAHGVWRNAINLPPSDVTLKPYMELAEKLGQFAAKLWFVNEPKRFFSIKLVPL